MKRRLYVGVSGFSYPGWRGKFYPKELKSEEFLAHYSQKLNSVEINSSFYAPPTATTVKSWSAKTYDGFKFSLKAPRQITHILKLGQGSAEPTERVWKTLELLESKRGPILFQLPPFAKQDLKLLETFLRDTSLVSEKIFEFRHASWLDEPTYKLLDKYEAGFCIADTEDMEPVLMMVGDVAYFRLRKDVYTQESIDNWSGLIGKLVKGASEVYVYLRHDETGENAAYALRLREQLEQAG